jgi:hypothetical protein
LSPDSKFIKIIPSTIGHYLNAKALACWIMSDGSKVEHDGLILHTESFTLEEVKLFFFFKDSIKILI